MRAAAAPLAAAGLFLGAAAWSLHQQSGYLVASWVCGSGGAALWICSLIAVLVLAAGGVFSFRAIRSPVAQGEDAQRSRHFLALISVMAAALFLFATLLQAATALFLPGCWG